jgi:ribose transport system substrate-binding protein
MLREKCMHSMRKFPGAFDRWARVAGRRWFCASTVVVAALVLAPAVVQADDLKTIGVIVADLGNPFFEQIGRDVEDVAARRIGPSTKVIVRSSGYDLDRQIQQINAMTDEKVDLLILNAVDTEQIGPAVRNAEAAGVVVVAIDVRASGAQATVTSDNYGAGRLACKYLAERLGGKGDVLILDGPPVSSVVERVKGCRTTFAAFPEINVLPDSEDCGGSIEGGLAYTTDVLTKYAHIDAVFAINDPTAIGADVAASRAGRSEFFIVSIDGSPHGAEVLRQKGTTLAATVVQDPRQMTEKAVTLGIQLFQGQVPDDRDVETPVYLLTSENVGDYSGWTR